MRQSLLTVALLAVLALAWMLRNLLVLVAYAGLLAYALNPIVNWVDRRLSSRRTIPRGISTAIVMFLLVLAAGASLAAAIPPLVRQFTEFASAAPGSVRRLEQEIGAFINSHGWGGLVQAGGAQTAGTLNSLLEAAGRWLMSGAGGLIGSLAGLASLVLLPLFTFYMLADSDRGRSGLLTLVSPAGLPRAQRLLDALDRALRAYVRGQASVCLIMGAAMAIVLGLLGFPVALLLGVAVAFAEIIPVAGFWLAASAIALEGFTVRPELALVGVGSYVVVNNLIQTFASPRLLGRQVQLHPLIVNLSVIGGGMLLGPAGAILALPAAAMARVLLEEFVPRRQGSPSPSRGITTTLS
ncbi:MAG TPA: AI-2E family transporter [Gemmatimonadales bacterium]|nr:AI-2E family transporter [Gemmatimonadales bacterium]